MRDQSGTDIGASGLLSGKSLVLVVMSTAEGWASATVIPTVSTATSGATTVNVSTKSTTMGSVSGTVSFAYDAAAQNNLINNGDYLALMYQDEEGLLFDFINLIVFPRHFHHHGFIAPSDRAQDYAK